MQDILTEVESIKQRSQKSVNELRGLSEFFRIFTKTYQEETESFDQRLYEHQEIYKNVNDSILSANLLGIYDCFNQFIKNTQSLMTKITNELISPLEFFRNNQFNIYQNNIDELREVNKLNKKEKDMMEYFRQSYYQASDIIKKESKRRKSFFSEAKDTYDTIIKNKMKAKNMEMIYKYEIERYNHTLPKINEMYDKIHEKIRLADKSRIMFIKTSFDKFKNYMGEYVNNINDFLKIIENYISNDICSKDEKHNLDELNKFKKEDKRISDEKFISFSQFVENEKLTHNNKQSINFVFVPSGIPNEKINNLEEKDIINFIKELVNDLIKENEVSGVKIAKLIELFLFKNSNSELEKKFLDTLIEKRKISSIQFYNLKNIEHLSNILSYITFKEESIFTDKFELNFKIIYLAERIFYKNKINNNKVYLSAILSKNKYYRTKSFWKNVMELKLANKLQDHMIRIKNYILPEEKNSTIFKKLKIQIKDSHKTSLIGKSHIVSLLKDYTNLEPTRIEIMDKMAIQEMTVILKNSIPNFSNFNVPSDISQDLVVEMVQEYKVPNDNINYCITFSNVSSHTIRRLLPHEKDSFIIENIARIGNKNKIEKAKNTKKVKIFDKIIPFLENKDFIKILLLCKFYNKKIKKKIYKYVLKQKNIKKEVRYNIWSNLLQIPKLKKEYNYREILSKANDEKAKYEIKIDITRTAVNPDNIEHHRNMLSNILYAISQCNGEIKYCQGMNFIASVLYEIFGEEESFYIFLSFFKNTDYPIIFAKDLQKLKVFFYVFNRIMQLYEPELSSYFTTRNATANTFLPPWFITLFMSSHQYIRDNINVMMRILDYFITSGWKGLIIVGISLLHNYEETLMNKKYESMMEFLINDILKSEFFKGDNIDKLEEYFETVKINKSLIKNIELEHIQNEKLNEATKIDK